MSGDDSVPPENPLLALYRRYLGEPESETDVYVGFALFFGGLALAALGFVVFLWNTAVPRDAALFVQLREVAIALVIVGLPGFALSVVVLLPTRRLVRYAGAVGALLCLAGAGVFVATFPKHWNVPGRADYSVHGITVYAAGVALLAASTGSALVTYHLERARARVAPEGEGGGADAAGGAGGGSTGGTGGTGGTGDSISEDRVRRDIEEAMESAEITWGGVQKSETRRLRIDTGDADADVDYSGLESGSAKTARAESTDVDDAVEGLRRLQGGAPDTGTSEGVDDQTAALAELRERQEREAEREPGSAVDRIRDRLGL